MLAAVAMWATGSGYFSQTIAVPGVVLVSIASGFGAVALAVILAVKGKLSQLRPASGVIAGYLLIIALGQALNNGTFFMGLKATSVANASLAHNLHAIFIVVLFAPLLLKERITKVGALAAFAGFGGLVLILRPSLVGSGFDTGILFATASAFFYGLYVVVGRKLSQKETIDPMIIAFWQLAVSALVFLPWVAGYFQDGGTASRQDWISLAIVGAILWAISLTFLFHGLKRVPDTTSATVLTYLEPIGAIILAAVIFGQAITATTVIGGTLILGASITSVVGGNRRVRKELEAQAVNNPA